MINNLRLSISLVILAFAAFIVHSGSERNGEVVWYSPGTITWEAKNFMYKAQGGFERWRFTQFNIPEGDFSQAQAQIEVDINSIYERTPELRDHLKTESFFKTNDYPVATITIDGSEKVGDTYFANARANIRGVETKIDLRFSVKDGQFYEIEGDALIDRNFHNIGMPKKKWGGNKITPIITIHFQSNMYKDVTIMPEMMSNSMSTEE